MQTAITAKAVRQPLPRMPTWAWILIGWLILAVLVSPFITACIHDDTDDEWP